MTASDQLKVINAGFRIIRPDEQNLKIKFKDKMHPEWSVLINGFKSKSELQRKVKELLMMHLIIED